MFKALKNKYEALKHDGCDDNAIFLSLKEVNQSI